MSLNAFLNPVKEENVKLVVSKRFVSEDGNPVEWEIKAMTAEENEYIRKACTRRVPINGKYGQFAMEFDDNKYISAIVAKCVVYPDLSDAELQNAYGVMGDAALLKKMLKPGEFTTLSDAVTILNGYDEEFGDLVDEGKN